MSNEPERQEPAASPIEIRVENLHKAFGDHQVLSGVDLEIRRGEMVAIVGASGGGKTVLLKHLVGRLHGDQGHVWVADHEKENAPLVDLATLDTAAMDELRRHWAVVFQKNALFTGTVYSNIALGLKEVKAMPEEEIRKRADEVIKAVGLEGEHVLEKDRDALSGGMAKRVAIARALALDPVLLFYDEPTSGLDPQHSENIRELIRKVHQSKPELGGARTSIIVTHDAGLLYALAPRVVMLHEGKVSFDGPAADFQKSDSPIIRPYLDLMPNLHCRVKPHDLE